jgi:hypothetical protein
LTAQKRFDDLADLVDLLVKARGQIAYVTVCAIRRYRMYVASRSRPLCAAIATAGVRLHHRCCIASPSSPVNSQPRSTWCFSACSTLRQSSFPSSEYLVLLAVLSCAYGPRSGEKYDTMRSAATHCFTMTCHAQRAAAQLVTYQYEPMLRQGELLLKGVQLRSRCDAGNDLTEFAQFMDAYSRCPKELDITPPPSWDDTYKMAAARLKVDKYCSLWL